VKFALKSISAQNLILINIDFCFVNRVYRVNIITLTKTIFESIVYKLESIVYKLKGYIECYYLLLDVCLL